MSGPPNQISLRATIRYLGEGGWSFCIFLFHDIRDQRRIQDFTTGGYIMYRPTYCCGVLTPEQDNDKTNVEPVHSYEAFHTRSDKPGVKGIIGMHRFNICLVVVLLWCENTIRPCFVSRHTALGGSGGCFNQYDGRPTGRQTILLWTNNMGGWAIAWSDTPSCLLKQALGVSWGAIAPKGSPTRPIRH